jgi:ferrous iron transport protein B
MGNGRKAGWGMNRKIALIGNPNTGKSSLFNQLTGLRQHVGNYPGITLDKKWGECRLDDETQVEILDLPGVYSVFPRSLDERVVMDILSDSHHADYPDAIVVVADATNLQRNLLLFTQVHDLGIPSVLVLTMDDMNRKQGVSVDKQLLSKRLGGVAIVTVNARTGEGVDRLKTVLKDAALSNANAPFSPNGPKDIKDDAEAQRIDAELRLDVVRKLLIGVVRSSANAMSSFTRRVDDLLVHRIWGYLIFLGVLLLIFQFIFRLAAIPMDLIDGWFVHFSMWAKNHMPEGAFTNLVAEGVIPGIGGVVVFVPQIAILFFFLSLLEESGYMARVVFLMDRLVRPFGLNGKSVVPLMSSVACAIPGIMATRTISTFKDRIITIMVAPLMSCSARIPVYTLLIALVIPSDRLWGVFDLQGLVLLGLYALGLFSALAVAGIMKYFIKTGEPSYLILELPKYRWPRWKQVGVNLLEKVRVFAWDAGRVIVAISIVLWALASYGPAHRIERAEQEALLHSYPENVEQVKAAARLENSYIGILGHAIEPFIKPLGYDWKMGIALITSFAAREVFVGSMATIYSVGEDFEEGTALVDRLREERWSDSGLPVYTTASGISLMVFYVYAMQCMATFAVVRRETKSWKWPFLQLVYMGVLAYLAAYLTVQLFA